MECFAFGIDFIADTVIGSASRLESFMLIGDRFHLEHAVDGIAVPISIKVKVNAYNFGGGSVVQLSNLSFDRIEFTSSVEPPIDVAIVKVVSSKSSSFRWRCLAWVPQHLIQLPIVVHQVQCSSIILSPLRCRHLTLCSGKTLSCKYHYPASAYSAIYSLHS